MCCKLNFHIICYCASSRPKHIIFLPQELCGKYYFITASFKSTCFAGFSFAWATFSIMENVFYIKWWVLQQCCSNRMKELCCICCIFSPPPFLISVFVCSHHILYMWLLELNYTAACQVTQTSDVYIHTVNIYACLSQAPYLSTLAEEKSSHTNWVYWKYSAAESGHCDANRLIWHCEVRHHLSSQAVDMILWHLTKS